MAPTIKWSDIEAECGDFRAGFIAVFRKYEGQPTDEKDGQGRTIKVTRASFARHMGIAEKTFAGWIRKQERPGRGPASTPEEKGRGTKEASRVLRDPQQRRKVIDSLDEEDRLAVADDALEPERKTGEDRKREQRVVREERSDDPEAVYLQQVRLGLAKIRDAASRAIRDATEVTWSDDRTRQLLREVGIAEELLGVLKLAVSNEAGVDWDAELARLIEAEEQVQ